MDPAQKKKYIAAGVSFVVIAIVVYFLFIFQKGPDKFKSDDGAGEIKDVSEISLKDKPYVTLTPTTDGAEIIVSIENMSFFDNIEYELTYLADNPQIAGEKIQRGSTGTDLNTKDPKYKKSILLGTASKGTRSPDRGITDGKLTMHLIKGEAEYLSKTEWNLFETGGTQATVKDQAGNVEVDIPATLGKIYWVILADTVGVPPTFDKDILTVATPIYGTFSVAPKFTKGASLTIKINKDATDAQLHLYSQEGKWSTEEVKVQNKTITTTITNHATFVVTTSN